MRASPRTAARPAGADRPRGSRIGAAALVVLLAAIFALLAGGSTPPADAAGGVARQSIGNFDEPVFVGSAPGVENRIYVVEQAGRIQAVDPDTPGTRTEFLDIANRVSAGGERGMLSVAFDPGFTTNRLLYVYYTNPSGDIEIDEFRAPTNTNASEASRRQVLTIGHRMAGNHNGGQLQFGPGGYLYAGTGDGGNFGDPRENAQNKSSLLGKLLRIDPAQHGSRPYASPASNPFVGRSGRDEILAIGLRNPWRFSFDGGRILAGDVGQDRFEEIDYETMQTLRHANFGWDRYEGFKRYRGDGDNEASSPSAANHDKPIFAYSHNRGCAITGGYVIRDPALPSLAGRYLYTDYCDGRLRTLKPMLGRARDDRPLGISVEAPTSFGEGPDRELYVTSRSGPVYRLVPG